MIRLPACPTLAKALHDGATVIRVPVMPQPETHPRGGFRIRSGPARVWVVDTKHDPNCVEKELLRDSPLGKPGDVVGVKEEWQWRELVGETPEQAVSVRYKVDGQRIEYEQYGDFVEDDIAPEHAFALWAHPATMPDWAIRLRYTVKAVRVERVADNWNEDERLCGPDQDGWFTEPAYAAAWNSRLTPDGERYGDVYPFDSNPWTIAAEVEREQK